MQEQAPGLKTGRKILDLDWIAKSLIAVTAGVEVG
jgi:hypothetical protein